jgi:hypothetical protein
MAEVTFPLGSESGRFRNSVARMLSDPKCGLIELYGRGKNGEKIRLVVEEGLAITKEQVLKLLFGTYVRASLPVHEGFRIKGHISDMLENPRFMKRGDTGRVREEELASSAIK